MAADKRNGYGILRLSETKDRYEGNWKDGKVSGYNTWYILQTVR